MSADSPFSDFLKRIRAGDSQAAEELVRKYESLIRRQVRLNLEDSRLNRVFDSMDVCQSVLKSFFVRTAAGQYDLEDPKELVRLLVRMARNKLASAARNEHRKKRDQRRTATGEDALGAVAGASPTPSRVIEARDLLAETRRRLTPEERLLADLRAQELTWEEIAQRLGGTAQARRVQLSRAIDRIALELRLDEDGDE
jgi:RNA polymerase sigma-70 factor (ECF subfamily)